MLLPKDTPKRPLLIDFEMAQPGSGAADLAILILELFETLKGDNEGEKKGDAMIKSSIR